MIYLVTKQRSLFDFDDFKTITVKESLEIMEGWTMLAYDSETTGRDPHLCYILSMQFGDYDGKDQIVVDCTTVSPSEYKEALETNYIIGQNLKFDLQFLYNFGIVPRLVYDTMIVEQLLHLGYPSSAISYSLSSLAEKYLGVHLDKTVRGQIIWRGLDTEVIKYGAKDVEYLGAICKLQVEEARKKECWGGARLECNFVPAIAYLEWCGIHLDEEKWLKKIESDREKCAVAEKALDDFIIANREKYPEFEKLIYINRQGSLFDGFDLTPHVKVNWDSSQQVVSIAKTLGFNTVTQDKVTGEDKDSVLEKHLKTQKGINDEFLKLYFDFKEWSKVCSTYGTSYLDAVNPETGRIHTVFRQLGAASGRMSCGSQLNNTDLAKVKQKRFIGYPQLQNLPADETTRACFTAEKGNLFCSCDYSALESRLGADIYNEQSMIREFLEGSGDMHSLCAYMVYKEIPRDTPIKDIKKLYPHLRKAVKGIEFSQQFGGSEYAIQGAMGCSLDEAMAFKEAYAKGFPGISTFKEKGSKFVRNNGYIVICQATGHKLYWWDWEQWKRRQESFTPEFWDDYKLHHKGTGDEIARMVSSHFKAASKYDRLALNCPTQGTGIIILKSAMTTFFNWIVDSGYFNKVKIVNLVHDEACIEYPETMPEVADKLKECMENAASKYCTKVPIPAEPEVGNCWIH